MRRWRSRTRESTRRASLAIKVIGAGLGRTGTTSLKIALEKLGFDPCYHMTEVFEQPEHIETWEAAVRGEPVDWEEVFRGYRATVDWPGAAFYEDLMERYPEAKVILTVRDPEGWYESVRNTIYQARKTASSRVLAALELFVPGVRDVRRATGIVEDLAWEGIFGGRFEDREHAIGMFDRLNGQVVERIPPDRLLVYDVKEGWGPLCAFLGAEVPEDEPFPRLNAAAAFRKEIRRRRALTYAVPGVAALLVASALFFLQASAPLAER